MPSLRKRKSSVGRRVRNERPVDHGLREWDEMQPVGREFGSPDFERLMAEDARAGSGVFDPALKSLFPRKRTREA